MDQKNQDQNLTEDKAGKGTMEKPNKYGRGIEKKYQEFIIKDYDEINFKSGTMDKNTYKGCFLEVKGHFKSKTDNYKLMMRKVLNQLRHGIERNIDKEFFSDKFITTTNISDSFSSTGSSFTTLEFTFFPKKKTDKKELTNKLNEICVKLYQEVIVDNDYMEFNKSIQRGKNGI
jgi:hypothetical protein